MFEKMAAHLRSLIRSLLTNVLEDKMEFTEGITLILLPAKALNRGKCCSPRVQSRNLETYLLFIVVSIVIKYV